MNLFTNSFGDSHYNLYNPLIGIVRWNNVYQTYEPLINSDYDFDNVCFSRVTSNNSSGKNYPDSYCEVIGNIHENPELLEG